MQPASCRGTGQLILAEPPPSPADLHFRIFDIPVRIHPFFWLIALLLTYSGGSHAPADVLLWVVALLVSILIHEFGHALVQRYYGGHPSIVLHGMGGLAICEDCDRSTRAQLLILFAGPGAGFLFALLLFVVIKAIGQSIGVLFFEAGSPPGTYYMNVLGSTLYWEPFESRPLNYLIFDLFAINILWGLVNLLPIYPLDGGQISRELLLVGRPVDGMILSLRLSIVCAVAMALVGLSWGSLFVCLLFGYLAYTNYRTLEAYRSHYY